MNRPLPKNGPLLFPELLLMLKGSENSSSIFFAESLITNLLLPDLIGVTACFESAPQLKHLYESMKFIVV
jgi:hypothetical protein